MATEMTWNSLSTPENDGNHAPATGVNIPKGVSEVNSDAMMMLDLAIGEERRERLRGTLNTDPKW